MLFSHTDKVKCCMIVGNHSSTVEYVFREVLVYMCPDVEFNSGFKYRDYYLLGENAIMVSHGDKFKTNRTHEVFCKEAGEIFGINRNRYSITGHVHHENNSRDLDAFGLSHYSVGTKKPNDAWETRNGYVSSKSNWSMFEFNETQLKTIYYI